MMEIIGCKNCGSSSGHFGIPSVNIELTNSQFCDCCYRVNSQHQHYHFCSIECFYQYMVKAINGDADCQIVWREYNPPKVQTDERNDGK